MKKTTKFLLVLAAVVAMTIGAVSTVMAADYPTIAEWSEDGKNAYDAAGNQIKSGWAKTEGLIYYYFVNGTYVTNNFITTGKEIYYVGKEGQMHTGWLEIKSDAKFGKNGSANNQFSLAWAIGASSADTEVTPFDNADYKTVWLYFDNSGAMAKNEWEQVDGIWYFFDNAYCVINDWDFNVKYDEDGKSVTATKYGFDKSGAMIAGWAQIEASNDDGNDKEGPTKKEDTKSAVWTYYAPSGKKVDQGWEKIDGDWFYFVPATKDEDGNPYAKFNEATYVAVEQAYVTIDGEIFYFDEDCYMQTGLVEIYNASEDIKVKTINIEGSKVTYGAPIEVKKKTTLSLVFGDDGNLKKGMQDGKYYDNGEGNVYVVSTDVKAVTGGSIVVPKIELKEHKDTGIQWTGDFLYVISSTASDGKVTYTAYYYENGVMIKNKAIQVGESFLAFGSDGKLVTDGNGKTLADGVKYAKSTVEVEDTKGNKLGIFYCVVK